MVPLTAATAVLHCAAYTQTGERAWLAAAGGALSIGAYTGLVLGGDIKTLLRGSKDDVVTTGRRFCRLHHARTFVAAGIFALALKTVAASTRK